VINRKHQISLQFTDIVYLSNIDKYTTLLGYQYNTCCRFWSRDLYRHSFLEIGFALYGHLTIFLDVDVRISTTLSELVQIP
jgi:hypothetical protein